MDPFLAQGSWQSMVRIRYGMMTRLRPGCNDGILLVRHVPHNQRGKPEEFIFPLKIGPRIRRNARNITFDLET